MLAKKFDLKYKSFEDWCATHAGSLPRVNAETAEERSLANWLKNKLTSCRQGKLPDEQLAKLKKIPGLSDFPGNVSQESRKHAAEFDGACKNLEDWCKTHGGVPSPSKKTGISPEEMSMAVWLKNKLAFNKRGKLPDDQIAKLRKVPLFCRQASLRACRQACIPSVNASKAKTDGNFTSEELNKLNNCSNAGERVPRRSHHEGCSHKCFEEWCTIHEGTLPRRSGETAEERSLAMWLTNRLRDYRRGKLAAEQVEELKMIPCLSDFPHLSQKSQVQTQKFECTCKSFKLWCASHKGTLPRLKGETKEERSLATWLKNKLYDYHCGKLPEEQAAELKELPGFMERSPSRSQKFDLVCGNFQAWYAAHNGKLPSKTAAFEEERCLAIWLRKQLQDYRQGKLAAEKMEKLKMIPCLSDFPHLSQKSQMQTQKFECACKSFKLWCARHKGTLPRLKGETKEERSLATWLKNKLYDYNCGKLPEEQVAKLKELPGFMERSPSRSQKFDLVCGNFQAWCAAHNGKLPSKTGKTEEERSLAMWLIKKRQNYSRGKLSDVQVEKVRKIPGLTDFPGVARVTDASFKI